MRYNIGDILYVSDNISGHPFPIGTEVQVFRELFYGNYYDVCNMPTGDCAVLHDSELLKTTDMQLMKNAVLLSANKLLKANNTVTTLEIKTDLIACQPQYYWKQSYVSQVMDEFAGAGKFIFTDTAPGPNQHRIYTDPNATVVGTFSVIGLSTKRRGRPRKNTHIGQGPTVAPSVAPTPALTAGTVVKKQRFKKAPKLTPSQAQGLMANNKGHFFTATFIKKDGTRRTINCQYMKDQTQTTTGYVKVRETGKLKTGVNAIRQVNLNTLEELKIAGKVYQLK